MERETILQGISPRQSYESPRTIIAYEECGCTEIDHGRSHWGLAGDVIRWESGSCYHCRCIAPRPEVGQVVDFLRFGPPPASGRSTNGRDGTTEAGVSCYAILDGRVLRSSGYTHFSDRSPHRGIGTVVGYGSDDEILVEIRSIRKIGPAALAKLEG